MKASFMKFNNFFLKLHYSPGEIDTTIKMIWEIFSILRIDNLLSGITLEISVPKLFFLHKISNEGFLYEIL